LEIVLGIERKTIRKSSIQTEISIPLTHKSMELLQKELLELLPGLLHHLPDLV
jgi:hypothetical protein